MAIGCYIKSCGFADFMKGGHEKAINYIYESLLEIETSEALKVLDKI